MKGIIMSEKLENPLLDQSHFSLVKKTRLEDIASGVDVVLPESDLSIQSADYIFQFKHVEAQNVKKQKFVIKPGMFSIVKTAVGIGLTEFESKDHKLLETIDNTQTIMAEASKFFSRLEFYKKRDREPRRSVLLASPPGVGKTAAINRVCRNFLKEEGTVVIVWDTSSISPNDVNDFYLLQAEFPPEIKKHILIMEDINGGTVDNYGGSRSSSSALLNFLDGMGSSFKDTPTFIIGTTNNPEQSVGALIDRPGRFDKVIELSTPNLEQTKELLAFIKQVDLKDLTETDIRAAEIACKEKFSIAHLQEVVVRSEIDDITTEQSALQLKKHKERFRKGFEEIRPLGMALPSDWD